MKARGFSIVEVIIIVVVVGIIGALGYVGYNNFIKPKTNMAQKESTAAPTSVTKIESASDLDAATNDLDAIDLTDASDTTTLDAQTSDL